MTLVTASRISSAPATVTSALITGISAERQPRNTTNSASSRIGSAISSPLTRSLWVAAIWSRITASSPPTFTVAPGHRVVQRGPYLVDLGVPGHRIIGGRAA